MIKKLYFSLCMFIISYSCIAQTFTMLEEGSVLLNLSRNAKLSFGCFGNIGTTKTYIYDITSKDMFIYDCGPFYDISDSGILGGQNADGIPALYDYKKNKWTVLPTIENFDRGGSVRAISSDGNMCCGYLVNAKGKRRPFIWNLQTDGTYSVEMLPAMEKDLTGRTPQGIDALRCSAKGNIIAGRIIDYSGGAGLVMYWKKGNDGQWVYELKGKNLVFKEGVEIPVLPEIPNRPNPMNYFSKEDSLKYNADVEAFKAGTITINPITRQQEYISDPDSIEKYNKAAIAYNEASALFAERLPLYNAAFTGHTLDVLYNLMSSDGRYFTASYVSPGTMYKALYSPMYFDFETGENVIFKDIPEGQANGVTDKGDLWYTSSVNDAIRNTFVIPAGTTKPVHMADWVKQESEGKLDISKNVPELRFTYEGMNPETYEPMDVVDSLIVGCVSPSFDGKTMMGSGYSPETGRILAYIVELGLPDDIGNTTLNSEVAIYPNPAIDILYFRGIVQYVSIIDLAGRNVYESNSVSNSIDVSFLDKGTYLVKLVSNGKTTLHKVIVAE